MGKNVLTLLLLSGSCLSPSALIPLTHVNSHVWETVIKNPSPLFAHVMSSLAKCIHRREPLRWTDTNRYSVLEEPSAISQQKLG